MKKEKMPASEESEESVLVKVKPRDINRWLSTTPMPTPNGGEILVESMETYDYPSLPPSDEEMVELGKALTGVLARYRSMTSEERQKRQAVSAVADQIFNTEGLNVFETLKHFIITGTFDPVMADDVALQPPARLPERDGLS